MTWKLWRARLLYLAMSVFVLWHATAIVVAPLPNESVPVDSLRRLFRPYLTLFRLESTWSFFESIPRLPQFRYTIRDAKGKEHTFVPVDEFSWYHPRYNWFERIYLLIMYSPESFGEHFAPMFCRRHAALEPVSITYLLIQGGDFRPEDRLAGNHPLSSGFYKVEPTMTVDCPAS
jgi:hypothetical protein